MAGFDIDGFISAPPAKGFDIDAFIGKSGPSPADVQGVRDLIGTPEQVVPRIGGRLYAAGSSPETVLAQLRQGEGQKPADTAPRYLGGKAIPLAEASAPPSNMEQLQGLGTAVSRGLDSASLGWFSRARDAGLNAISPGSGDNLRAQEAETEARDPFGVGLGRGIGYLTGAPLIAGKTAATAVGRVIPEATSAAGRFFARLAGGAGSGALANAGIAAGEAGAAGASPGEMLGAAGQAAKAGAVVGGGFGAVAGVADAAAPGASARQDARIVNDLTDEAAPGRVAQMKGRGGAKTDRVVELVKRNPGLLESSGDPRAAMGEVQGALDDIQKRQDAVYANAPSTVIPRAQPGGPVNARRGPAPSVRVEDVTTPMVEIAKRLDASPNVIDKRMAREILTQANAAYEAWNPASDPHATIDPRTVRTEATKIGRGLFRGDPSVDPTQAKQIKTEVFGSMLDAISASVEKANPGAAQELAGLNADMSDLLHIQGVLESRAAKAPAPGPVPGLVSRGLDLAGKLSHPAHFAVGQLAPGADRALDSALADRAPGPLTRYANPILSAASSERDRSRQRAAALTDSNARAQSTIKNAEQEALLQRFLQVMPQPQQTEDQP